MRTGWWVFLGLCGTIFLASVAAEARAGDLKQPADLASQDWLVAYGAADQPKPADKAASAEPPTPSATSTPAAEPSKDASGGDEEKPTCRWCQCGKLADPWTLPQPCFLKERGIEIHGWADSGIYGNNHAAPFNGPLGFNNYSDYNLHQLTLFAEKKTDTEKNCWDVGGRIEYVYGVDGPKTQAFGDQSWDYGWNSSNRYGSAIPQMYTEIAHGDWSLKAGRFYTPAGYEVVQSTGNFFYSHSYTSYYGEPFTHTGFMLTRKFSDEFSAFGGWVDGWDSGFENQNGADNFLGGYTWNMSEKATFAYVATIGHWGSGLYGNKGDIFLNTLVLTLKITDKWTYVAQHDLGINSNNGGADTHWYGLNQYLLYKINDCWSAGGRFEWFRDQEGVRVVAGNAGSYYEATLGVNYKPHANVLLRPEIRWDWYDGTVTTLPFNNGTSESQFSGGFDVVVTF